VTKGDDSLFMQKAEDIIKVFLQLTSEDRLSDAKKVFPYYEVCVKEDPSRKQNIEAKKEVWDFVTPTDVFIERHITGIYYITVSCTCAWEKQHGLQLVFREGKKLTRATGHDGQFEN